MEELSGAGWRVLVGDVRDGLSLLGEGSVHCCVTSPPYWGLRDYGYEGQIGLEKTPGEFVSALVDVFRGVRRVLRDDGVLWVNLGDSYAASGKGGGGGSLQDKSVGREVSAKNSRRSPADGFQQGDLVGIPWSVAFAMQADGWVLRQCVVWHKRSPMPCSVSGTQWKRCRVKVGVSSRAKDKKGDERSGQKPHGDRIGRDFASSAKWEYCPGCRKCEGNGGLVLKRGSWRPTTAHEFVFQFVKCSGYFSDGDGSKEKAAGGVPGNKTHKHVEAYRNGDKRMKTKEGLCNMGPVETRNQRSVWTLSAEPFKGAHFAVFPTELVRRCLSSSISPAGCCSVCGEQYAPIVESVRVATRPGTNSKVAGQSSGSVGNRDPERHTTTTRVIGYRATCRCEASVGRPVVLDCFGGSMTTGQVALSMGCDFVGLEASREYAELGIGKRLSVPLKVKGTSKSKRVAAGVRSLFGEL